ncbi:MAG: hypothetical protein ACM3VX_06620 [Bacteroidota bacterium]
MKAGKNLTCRASPATRLMDRRAAIMVGFSVITATLAFLVGYPMTAGGVAAATPLALFNHYMMQLAVRKAEHLSFAAGTRRILYISLGRMLLGMAALLGALLVSVEFLIGVLFALVSESLVYLAGLLGRQSRG